MKDIKELLIEKEKRDTLIREVIFDLLRPDWMNEFSSPNDLKPETNIRDDLGADSLDELELVMCFEEKLGIDIADETAEQIVTVGDAYKLADEIFQAGMKPCTQKKK